MSLDKNFNISIKNDYINLVDNIFTIYKIDSSFYEIFDYIKMFIVIFIKKIPLFFTLNHKSIFSLNESKEIIQKWRDNNIKTINNEIKNWKKYNKQQEINNIINSKNYIKKIIKCFENNNKYKNIFIILMLSN